MSVSSPQSISLSGIIKNPIDKPIKNAIVTLRNLKDEILFEATSSRKGKFEFENIDPKFYYLLVEHEFEGSKRIKLNPRKNNNRNIEFSFILMIIHFLDFQHYLLHMDLIPILLLLFLLILNLIFLLTSHR